MIVDHRDDQPFFNTVFSSSAKSGSNVCLKTHHATGTTIITSIYTLKTSYGSDASTSLQGFKNAFEVLRHTIDKPRLMTHNRAKRMKFLMVEVEHHQFQELLRVYREMSWDGRYSFRIIKDIRDPPYAFMKRKDRVICFFEDREAALVAKMRLIE